ncbi:MAG TPA: hypothetical protein VGC30_09720 [Dokdonella sp.]
MTAYGEAFDSLYRIDLDTRQATLVGPAGRYGGVPITNISGLTAASDGAFYAVSGALKLLLKVDPTSGAGNVVGPLGLAGQGSGQFDALDLGMTVDCDGTLWLASGTSQQLWRVDARSGSLTPVGTMGHRISGLVARGDELYGSGDQGDHTFYRIDKTTGAATAIGGFGPSVPSYLNSVSMSFDDAGTLWAVLNYVPPADGSVVPDWADLATIDPATGVVTVLGPITGPESLRQLGMKGFTLGPTPCRTVAAAPIAAPAAAPSTLAVLGALLAFAALRRSAPKRG